MSYSEDDQEDKKSSNLKRKIANAFIRKRGKGGRPKSKRKFFEGGVSSAYVDNFEEDKESGTNKLLKLIMEAKTGGGGSSASASVISAVQKWIKEGVSLSDIDFATLQNMDLDSLPASALQELIEFLLKYHPDLVNLNMIDLTKLDLKRIDFRKLNLRGVNLLGVDLDQVNLVGVDLTGAIVDPKYVFKGLDLHKGSAKIDQKQNSNFNAFGVDMTKEFDHDNDKDDVEYDPSHFSEEFKEKFELKYTKKVVRKVKSRPSVKLHESEFSASEHDFPDLFKAERSDIQDNDNKKTKREAHKAVLNAKKEEQRAKGVSEKEEKPRKVKRRISKVRISKNSKTR